MIITEKQNNVWWVWGGMGWVSRKNLSSIERKITRFKNKQMNGKKKVIIAIGVAFSLRSDDSSKKLLISIAIGGLTARRAVGAGETENMFVLGKSKSLGWILSKALIRTGESHSNIFGNVEQNFLLAQCKSSRKHHHHTSRCVQCACDACCR